MERLHKEHCRFLDSIMQTVSERGIYYRNGWLSSSNLSNGRKQQCYAIHEYGSVNSGCKDFQSFTIFMFCFPLSNFSSSSSADQIVPIFLKCIFSSSILGCFHIFTKALCFNITFPLNSTETHILKIVIFFFF